MKNPGMNIRHPKARGEWAELRFMVRATELGFCVTKPWGDMAPFDLALEHRGHFARVQVKCTIYHRGHSYKCHLDSNGIPYRPRPPTKAPSPPTAPPAAPPKSTSSPHT